ncbi:MAG: imelysin family protein [Thalassovita sp.]
MRLSLILAFVPSLVMADPRVDAALDDHILPAFETLSSATEALAEAQSCAVEPQWHAATAAWIAASHLRFGPSEVDNRAFALAFWPDPRGNTRKTVARLLTQDTPDLSTASVAGRGFYALEYLLFDAEFQDNPNRCALIDVLTSDVQATVQDIQSDWQERYADLLRNAGGNDTYQNPTEALQELYKVLLGGLQFDTDMRLARPLGTFDRPRPNRAEMRRSERSLENVSVSLRSLESLAVILSAQTPEVQTKLVAAFQRAQARAAELSHLKGASDFSLVSDVSSRLKVEILQQEIVQIHLLATQELGPALGVGAGFNALDGD